MTSQRNGNDPGPEMDALVAEKVMGWKKANRPDTVVPWQRWETGDKRSRYTAGDAPVGILSLAAFRPSTDIRAAWEVVEKLRERSDGHFTLFAFTTNWRACWATADPDDLELFPWDVEEIDERDPTTVEQKNQYHAVGQTAPHAICLAALKAVGDE